MGKLLVCLRKMWRSAYFRGDSLLALLAFFRSRGYIYVNANVMYLYYDDCIINAANVLDIFTPDMLR